MILSFIAIIIVMKTVTQIKMQYLHFRSHAGYFLLSWKIPEVISRQSIQDLFITKESIYYVNHNAHTLLEKGVLKGFFVVPYMEP